MLSASMLCYLTDGNADLEEASTVYLDIYSGVDVTHPVPW